MVLSDERFNQIKTAVASVKGSRAHIRQTAAARGELLKQLNVSDEELLLYNERRFKEIGVPAEKVRLWKKERLTEIRSKREKLLSSTPYFCTSILVC